MADTSNNSGSGNATMAFILGAVVVVLAGLVYFIYTGDNPVDDGNTEINITVPDEIVPGNE